VLAHAGILQECSYMHASYAFCMHSICGFHFHQYSVHSGSNAVRKKHSVTEFIHAILGACALKAINKITCTFIHIMEGNVVLVLHHETYGGMEVKFHAFLTSELDGGEWIISRPSRFTSRERAPGTH
jgi:hypothetical protein